jgi:hypothetical protein
MFCHAEIWQNIVNLVGVKAYCIWECAIRRTYKTYLYETSPLQTVSIRNVSLRNVYITKVLCLIKTYKVKRSNYQFKQLYGPMPNFAAEPNPAKKKVSARNWELKETFVKKIFVTETFCSFTFCFVLRRYNMETFSRGECFGACRENYVMDIENLFWG